MQKNPYARVVNLALFSGIAFAVTFLDLVSKAFWFHVHPQREFIFLNGWIQHTVHANTGALANIPLPLTLLIILSVGVCTWILVMLYKTGATSVSRATLLGYALLFGGALGNLYDRVTLGFVRDWILIASRSAVNLADIWIILGCVLLFLSLSRQRSENM